MRGHDHCGECAASAQHDPPATDESHAEQRMRDRTQGDSTGGDRHQRGRAEEKCGEIGEEAETAKVPQEKTSL